MNNKIMRFIILLLLAWSIVSQQMINNVPITFSLSGNVNYIPTSGGIAIPGFTFNMGFDGFAWIGITFMTKTSTNNYDTLIMQRSSLPSTGTYTCTIKDYYISPVKPTTLNSDAVTNMDKSTTSSSSGSYFSLSFPRTKGNTNGEDWQGEQFAQICFFTSDISFTESTWSKQYQACYGYQISSTYISTFRGVYLGDMNFENYNSRVYGGVLGPYLQLKMFWHRKNQTMANTSAIIIQIGGQISDIVGNDYYVCGTGDYHGSISSLQLDLSYSGYDNGKCNMLTSASSVMLDYTRDVYTYDQFDNQITQNLRICLVGANYNCGTFYLPILYPIQSVGSALKIFEKFIKPFSLLILAFFTMIMI